MNRDCEAMCSTFGRSVPVEVAALGGWVNSGALKPRKE